MECVVHETLNDGTPVIIQLIGPDDKEKLADGFCKLSPQSVKFRFAGPLKRLSKEQLVYLTHIDYFNHVAYCAIDQSKSDLPGIGVGRYIRLEDDPKCAEIAITVIDEYQRRGLGTKLIAALAEAAAEFGITRFCAYILPENRGMRLLLEQFDAVFSGGTTSLLRAEFSLDRVPAIQRSTH